MLLRRCGPRVFRRMYRVLAIESSCDDACVTLLERGTETTIVEEAKHTLNSVQAGGVVPADAARHNRIHVPLLANELLRKHGWTRPDLVCVTRGPGMTGSLVAGYQFALGLAVAWQVPFVGVNHLLGHLLMVRLGSRKPSFPFLSLLASGGHTMLVLSKSVTEHEILVNTIDIAAGDALDKCGRELGFTGNMIGKQMDEFVNDHPEEWGKNPLELTEPLKNKAGRKDVLEVSFAAYISQLRRSLKLFYNNQVPSDMGTVAAMAHQIESAIFQHVINKIKLAIRGMEVDSFVCSGGVGASPLLRSMLQDQLQVSKFYFPPPERCTDNSTMIGWAGIELYESGITTDLGTTVIRKWPLDKLMDLEGWKRKEPKL